jgi:hypothetical protein
MALPQAEFSVSGQEAFAMSAWDYSPEPENDVEPLINRIKCDCGAGGIPWPLHKHNCSGFIAYSALEPKKSALSKQVSGTHYKALKIQPVEYIHANGIGFCEGNAIKYLSRWREKGGVSDLEKAKHFIDLLIELESKK